MVAVCCIRHNRSGADHPVLENHPDRAARGCHHRRYLVLENCYLEINLLVSKKALDIYGMDNCKHH